MAKKRRKVRMDLVVSVPKGMTAIQARREVRTLITNQCNYSAEPEDVRVVRCTGVKKDR